MVCVCVWGVIYQNKKYGCLDTVKAAFSSKISPTW